MSETSLDKTFDPAAIEAKWYAHWEAGGLFRPHRPDAAPFTLVNPPPNVTGSLHIGHALDNTLQDVVIRYERLRGKDALWVVGTDHAGIATQMVVERQLEAAQDKRTNYSREDFIAKVWEWKAESGGDDHPPAAPARLLDGLVREQFTMDPHFTRAVVKVFVDLYNQGLIYRDKRLVNWDPKLKTAISDLEVETREIKGQFWHFRYPLADGVKLDSGADHIVVATTRPETMLADMAVAVNADDPRYQSVIGKDDRTADHRAAPARSSPTSMPIRNLARRGQDHAGARFQRLRGGQARRDQARRHAQHVRCRGAGGADRRRADPGRSISGLDRFVVREHVVADLKALGCLVPHVVKDKDGEERTRRRTAHHPDPLRRPRRRGDRAVADRPVVCRCRHAGPAADRRRCATGGSRSCRRAGKRPSSTGWRTSSRGACQPPAVVGAPDPGVVWAQCRQTGNADGITFEIGNDSRECEDASFRRRRRGSRSTRATMDDGSIRIADVDTSKMHLIADCRRRCKITSLWRDPDVLDTWFSSALWPFATLGWPDAKSSPARGGGPSAAMVEGHVRRDAERVPTAAPPPPLRGGPPPRAGEDLLLARHYPNDLLISGFDILFFWDARMAMQGMHFMAMCRGSGSTCTGWCAPPTGRRCPSPRATSSIRCG